LIWRPLPTPSLAPAPPPVIITIPSGGDSPNEDETVTLLPTWVVSRPVNAPSGVPGSNENSPQDNQNNPPVAPPSPSITNRFDPVPQDLNIATPSQSTFALVFGTQTLLPGHVITIGGSTTTLANSQPSVVNGVPVHLDVQRTFIVVGGSTTIPVSPTPVSRPAPYVLELEGITYTADSLGRFIVGSQTLLPGGYIVLDQTTATLANGQTSASGGTIVYLDPQGTAAIIDGRTSSILQRAQPTGVSKLTVFDGKTYTVPANGPATIVVGGLTIDMPSGGRTVVGGKTVTLTEASAIGGIAGSRTSLARGVQSGDTRASTVMTSGIMDQADPSSITDQGTEGGDARSEASRLGRSGLSMSIVTGFLALLFVTMSMA
jgi:hypothetical protein